MKDQLRTLSILHYVAGGLHALFSSFALIHFFVGLAFVLHPEVLANAHDKNGQGMPFPAQWFGALFMTIGGAVVLLGWTAGALTIYSGRCIARRRRRTFSIVIAAINCMMFPFGTGVGVYGLITLTKNEARREYGEAVEPVISGQ